MRLRQRIFQLLEAAQVGDPISRGIDLSIMLLILLNVLAAVLETVPSIGSRWPTFFATFEQVSVLIFAAEYSLRLWSCTASTRYAHPVTGRIRFALHPMLLIDLIAFLPGLLLMVSADLRMLRGLRLLRLLRILRLTRYSATMQVFGEVLRRKAPELLSTLFVMFLLLTMASSVMFFIERGENPDFDSIPAAMWWGIVTLTTVGYGDIAPVTPLGKAFGACVAILGIGMFAIPAGVLGAAFSEHMSERRKSGR